MGKALTTRRFWSARWTGAIHGFPHYAGDDKPGDLYLTTSITDGPMNEVARQREVRVRVRPEQLDRLADVVREAIAKRDAKP